MGHAELDSGSSTVLSMKDGFIYIIANFDSSVIYIGITSDPFWRVLKHKLGSASKFTSKYKTLNLVYIERLPIISQAIERDKQLRNTIRTMMILRSIGMINQNVKIEVRKILNQVRMTSIFNVEEKTNPLMSGEKLKRKINATYWQVQE
ncbi:MAG: GIY-YIG nuclease family protein [Bacteroidetes bacterium]|nr:GIY-YIG nuclease family protein [Bacteroidota bacterium]